MKIAKKEVKLTSKQIIDQPPNKFDKNSKIITKNKIETPKNINIEGKLKNTHLIKDVQDPIQNLKQVSQPEKEAKRQVKASGNLITAKNDVKAKSTVQALTAQLIKSKDKLDNYERQIEDYEITTTMKDNKIKELIGQIQELKKQNCDLKVKNEKIKKAFDQNNKIIRNQINSYNQEASEIQSLTKQIQLLKKQSQSTSLVKIDSCINTESTFSLQCLQLSNSSNSIINHKSNNQISLEVQIQIQNDCNSTANLKAKDQFEEVLKQLKNQYKQKLNSIQSLSNTLNQAYNTIINEKQQEIHKLESQIDRLYDEKQMGYIVPKFEMDEALLRSIQENQRLKNIIQELREKNLSLRIQMQEALSENRRISNQLQIERHKQTLMKGQTEGKELFEQQMLRAQNQDIKRQLQQVQLKNNALFKQNKQKDDLIKLMSIKKKVTYIK